MTKYYSRRKASRWLKYRVHYADPRYQMSPRFLKKLKEDCRLIPAKSGLFGDRYSESQLKRYAHEMRF